MDFFELNKIMWQFPGWIHLATFAFLVVCYSHMVVGFIMIRKKLKPHVKRYFTCRTLIMLIYLFLKADNEQLGMFDLFLPIYIFCYLDGLIILNGFGFHRCPNLKAAIIKIFKFSSTDNSNYPMK